MANVTMKFPTELEEKLSRLGDKTDNIIPKVLEAGGKVVLEKARSNLQSAIGRGTKIKSRSTGELSRSLGLSKARQKRDGSGWDIKIGFAEPRRGKGDSNAKIGNILEHGRHGQPPRPFLKPARTQSKNDAIKAMEQKLEQEVDGV